MLAVTPTEGTGACAAFILLCRRLSVGEIRLSPPRLLKFCHVGLSPVEVDLLLRASASCRDADHLEGVIERREWNGQPPLPGAADACGQIGGG